MTAEIVALQLPRGGGSSEGLTTPIISRSSGTSVVSLRRASRQVGVVVVLPVPGESHSTSRSSSDLTLPTEQELEQQYLDYKAEASAEDRAVTRVLRSRARRLVAQES